MNVDPNPQTVELLYSGKACSQQLGLGVHDTIEQCADAANEKYLEDGSCDLNMLMWSDNYYKQWGCRCCNHLDPMIDNSNWDIYTFDHIATNNQTANPSVFPTKYPTTNPTVDPTSDPSSNPTNGVLHILCLCMYT